MARERNGITPALVVSGVVHVGALLAVIFLGGIFKKPMELGGGVPVTLVAEGPPILRDAPQGPEEQLAQTEEPSPLPPEPDPAPPAPQPTPAPPQPAPPKPAPTPTPKPSPSPTPKPTKPAPTTPPAKPAKPSPSPSLDFDRLLSDLQGKSGKPGGGRPGPAKPNTTPAPGSSPGEVSQAAKGYANNLGKDLGRRWNPNCEVEGGDKVNITVQIIINSNGRLIGDPKVIRGAKDDPITKAAITRAIFAVRAAEPFKEFPAELAGEKLNFNLNAQTACSM